MVQLGVARACLSRVNVYQYYMISRATIVADLLWSDLVFVGDRELRKTIRQLTVGRKIKTLPTKCITREVPDSVAAHQTDCMHPVMLLSMYRRAVVTVAQRQKRPLPDRVWQLVTPRS